MNKPNRIDESLNGTENRSWKKLEIAEVSNLLKHKSRLIPTKAKVLQAQRNEIGLKWVIKKETNQI